MNYITPGAEVREAFNSLPKDAPSGGNLETLYPNGWTDDSTTVSGNRISLPGWYLYHPADLPEGGSNGHQRLRIGPGANTGSFWGFGSSSSDEDMALGSIGSSTVAGDGLDMFIAMRITNQTGIPLSSFTLIYDGEQWRDGQSASGETLRFGWSTTATDVTWHDTTPGLYTEVATLSYTSPVVAGLGSSGSPVNGNIAGLTSNISATITGLDWQPGTDLWLRWADPQLAGNADDGLAIDNVRFSAVPESCLLAAGFLVLWGRKPVRRPVA